MRNDAPPEAARRPSRFPGTAAPSRFFPQRFKLFVKLFFDFFGFLIRLFASFFKPLSAGLALFLELFTVLFGAFLKLGHLRIRFEHFFAVSFKLFAAQFSATARSFDRILNRIESVFLVELLVSLQRFGPSFRDKFFRLLFCHLLGAHDVFNFASLCRGLFLLGLATKLFYLLLSSLLGRFESVGIGFSRGFQFFLLAFSSFLHVFEELFAPLFHFLVSQSPPPRESGLLQKLLSIGLQYRRLLDQNEPSPDVALERPGRPTPFVIRPGVGFTIFSGHSNTAALEDFKSSAQVVGIMQSTVLVENLLIRHVGQGMVLGHAHPLPHIAAHIAKPPLIRRF